MASAPRFFLKHPPDGAPPRLAEGEALHARQVLRMSPGDTCLGLDGQGHTWPMRAVAATRRELGFEISGPAEFEPEAGALKAPLPWIEVAVAWPRRSRAEEMVRRLTQLGAARITPLVARQAGPQKPPEADDPRWMRVLRDSCKQSRRAWLPQLVAPLSPAELALARPQASLAVLDPARGGSMDTWARALLPFEDGLGTSEHPIVLIVGPEGGFDDDERQTLDLRGATSVRVAPHVLRVETAAEAGMAIAAACWMRTPAADAPG